MSDTATAEPKAETVKRNFPTIEEARKAADALNAVPLAPGKTARNPFKPYSVSVGDKTGFAVGQTPSSALSAVYLEYGVKVDLVDGGPALMPVDTYLSRLDPAQLEKIKEYLAAAGK